MKYLESLKKLQHDESGQDLIEYALIAALLALAAVAGMNGLAKAINAEYGKISGNLT